MPRATLNVTTSAFNGATQPAFTAVNAANGNMFTNTGRELIEITNGAASPITITLVTEATSTYGLNVADVNVSITNGATMVFGPFDTNLFSVTSGTVGIDFSSGASVTARVTKLGST